MSTRRAIAILCAGALGTTLLGVGTQPVTNAGSAVDEKIPSPALLDRAEVAAKMIASVTSSPVLHMKVKCTLNTDHYEAEGWMTATKVRAELRKAGELVFAQVLADGRAQEYVPRANFKNGTQATGVLLEYDSPLEKMDDWPRLMDQEFACGPGGVVSVSWLKELSPTVPEMIADNMQSANMTETVLEGRTCYWFHTVVGATADAGITWNLYVDKATFKPVRQLKVVRQGGKKVKDEARDYWFEHLQDDSGVVWRLDPRTLK